MYVNPAHELLRSAARNVSQLYTRRGFPIDVRLFIFCTRLFARSFARGGGGDTWGFAYIDLKVLYRSKARDGRA